MIIRYHSKDPGMPLQEQQISRQTFELIDNDGNRWRISDVDRFNRTGIHLLAVEGSQGMFPELNVVPVSGNVVDLEMRP